MGVKRGLTTAPQLVANATSIVFTQTASTRSVFSNITMYANAAVTGAELYLVPSGGTANTTTRLFKRDFAADETYTVPDAVGQGILAAGTLRANDGGGGGSLLNIIITRTEYDGESV